MLKSDKDGFLVGERMSPDASAKLLAAIKGDTGKILAAMRSARTEPVARRAAVPSGRGAARGDAAPGPAMQPASRRPPVGAAAGVQPTTQRAPLLRQRDAAGRFVAAQPATDRRAVGGGDGVSAAASASSAAKATEALAQSIERQRKDERADRANTQRRKSNGQFGDGGGVPGVGGALAGSAGAAIDGAEQVDPLVGAVGEVRGFLGKVRDVASPLGRAASGALGGGDESPSLLRRMLRELRSIRKDNATSDRSTLAKLAALAKARGSGGDGGGGLLGGLLSALPGVMNPLTALGALGTSAAAATVGLKAILKRVPLIGALVDAVVGVAEDSGIANDASLSPEQRRMKRMENAGSTGGGIAGALAGAAIGQAVIPIPVVGAVVGAVAGGFLGKKAGGAAGGAIGKATAPEGIGAVSAKFESGGAGAGAVSSGKGDFGGASYGTHQLSSKTGTLQKYLGQSKYGAQFSGLQPGTPEFNARWKQIAASDPAFGQDQKDFISKTHFEPQMAHLQKAGIDLSGKGDAVKDAVWSTAVQFGGKTDLIKKALAGKDVAGMNDADVISAIQDYKMANNASLFKSSSAAVQAGTLKRAGEEKKALLALSGQAPTAATATAAAKPPAIATVAAAALPKPVALPQVPAMPAAPVIPPMPAVDPAPIKLNSDPAPAQAASPPPAPPAQDVRDRLIAHITTGGIGGMGAIAHR